SEKHKWFDKRLEYYSELAAHALQKYQKSKLETVDTMLLLVSAMNDFFKKEGNRYHKTKDVDILKSFDSKMFAQYLKTIEMVEKIMEKTADGDAKPLVNINNYGGTVKQVDNNTVE